MQTCGKLSSSRGRSQLCGSLCLSVCTAADTLLRLLRANWDQAMWGPSSGRPSPKSDLFNTWRAATSCSSPLQRCCCGCDRFKERPQGGSPDLCWTLVPPTYPKENCKSFCKQLFQMLSSIWNKCFFPQYALLRPNILEYHRNLNLFQKFKS